MKKLHYEQSGDNYKKKDPVKIIALKIARKTSKNLNRFKKYGINIREVKRSRGESAYRINFELSKAVEFEIAHVEESIGTKNIVADELERIYGKTFYHCSAIDNAATIFNDLSTSGAFPVSFMLHIATFPNEWYTDNLDRWVALLEGTAQACNMAGAAWGGGESATDRDIIFPGKALLSGSAVGIILPPKLALSEDKLKVGDRIVLLASSGVHANGITLLRRELLKRLPQGYKTKLSDKTTYGETLIKPAIIYSRLVEEAIRQTEIHYGVHITGHGWRKLMRANQPFSYVIDSVPRSQPIFEIIQRYSECSDREMYETYNMGAGFALFVPEKSVGAILKIAKKLSIPALNAGLVERGPKKVVIKPLGLEYTGQELLIR